MKRKLPPLVALDLETGKAEFMRAVPEGVDFIVVIPFSIPLALPDNKLGNCYGCGQAVQFRPENEGPIPKLCMACAIEFAEGSAKPN
jgi:acyl-CoA reductase-like NAD-dependent aldehyde dehydrogenase